MNGGSVILINSCMISRSEQIVIARTAEATGIESKWSETSYKA
jgi:hypothetical protein